MDTLGLLATTFKAWGSGVGWWEVALGILSGDGDEKVSFRLVATLNTNRNASSGWRTSHSLISGGFVL